MDRSSPPTRDRRTLLSPSSDATLAERPPEEHIRPEDGAVTREDDGPGPAVAVNGACSGPHVERQCRRHGARKVSPRPGPLCGTCSQVMLGYVAALQEFLEVMAGDIADGGGGRECLWCVKDHLLSDVVDPGVRRDTQSDSAAHQVELFTAADEESRVNGSTVPEPPHVTSGHVAEGSGQPPVHQQKRPPDPRDAPHAPVPTQEGSRSSSPPETAHQPREPQAPSHAPAPRLHLPVATSAQNGSGSQDVNACVSTSPPWPGQTPHSPPEDATLSPCWLECPPPTDQSGFASLTTADLGPAPLPRAASCDRLPGLDQPWTPEPEAKQEAYVTMATDNLHALGCLVLGNSLRLSGTIRTTVVLVTDAVSTSLKHLLGSVFHVVQSVRSLDPLGTTKLALLEQPELGVSFSKLHVWRLTDFTKCVFLEADTLVIKNCDELFARDELSAVPDIGWPDFFNCGLFVFVPSLTTFGSLVEFADKRGCSDGGEQGLLNLYFQSWSSDITKRLPFIYNLMANVSYTYTPAFRKFGKDVKVVHFFGTYKPWHVQFHYTTGQMSPSANVHPTFAQFVYFWMDIFQKRVLPLFPVDVHRYCQKNCYVSGQELMNFFPPPPAGALFESLPTPPSFRVMLPSVRKPLAEVVMGWSEHKEGQPEEEKESSDPSEEGQEPESRGPSEEDQEQTGSKRDSTEEGKGQEETQNLTDVDIPQEDQPLPSTPANETSEEEVNGSDYHKMAAWEQGRMDYLGHDSSDNIIRRLEGLITSPKKQS